MSSSTDLWPDPAPDVSWEVWSEDTFDREARPIRDRAGKGLHSGLKSLWVRFLLETVRPDGAKGFTRFYLRRQAGNSIRIQGQWEGAIRLRKWIFGKRTMASRRRLEPIDRQLFEAIVHTHGQMVLLGGTSEPILAAAAAATDRSEFGEKLERLAEPWGVRLNNTTLGKARYLDPLPEFKPKPHSRRESQEEGLEETVGRSEPAPSSWLRGVPVADYRLLRALAFLLIGLFLAAIYGRQASLSCNRIESKEVDCFYQSSWLNLLILDEQSMEGVWRARVQQVCDVNSCAAFPELDTQNGPVRLSTVASSGSSTAVNTVDRINHFIDDDQVNELAFAFEYGVVQLIMPILATVVGILFLITWFKHWRTVRN